MDIFYAAQRVLLDSYGPPSVVVTAEGDIIYVNGRTGRYLEPSSGKVNVNVFAMARQGLREELGIAIHNAAKQQTTVTQRGVKVKSNGGFSTINLTVRPLAESADLRGMFLIVFEEVPPAAQADACRRRAARQRSRGGTAPHRASTSRPASKKCRPPKRNSAPPMRSCSPTTRNCRAPTRN